MTDLNICQRVHLCVMGPTVTKSNTCGFWHINTLFNRWECACIVLCHAAEVVFWHCESLLNSHDVVQTLPGWHSQRRLRLHSTASVRRRPPASPQINSRVLLTWCVKSTNTPTLHQMGPFLPHSYSRSCFHCLHSFYSLKWNICVLFRLCLKNKCINALKLYKQSQWTN